MTKEFRTETYQELIEALDTFIIGQPIYVMEILIRTNAHNITNDPLVRPEKYWYAIVKYTDHNQGHVKE